MADGNELPPSGAVGMRRRDFLTRSAAAGALVWAAPQIVSAHPAAASGSPGPCEEVFSDDFEDYADGQWTNDYRTIPNGATFGPWTVTQGNIDLIRNGQYGACDGIAVDLYGTNGGPGRIEVSIATVVGAEYTLRYDLGQNGEDNQVRLSIGGTEWVTIAPNEGCVQQPVFFTPTSTTTVIWFQDEDKGSLTNGGAVIDNVVVELCPTED